MCEYIFSCEAQLFVKHLVWSGKAEALKPENNSVGTHKALQIYRKPRGETENICP